MKPRQTRLTRMGRGISGRQTRAESGPRRGFRVPHTISDTYPLEPLFADALRDKREAHHFNDCRPRSARFSVDKHRQPTNSSIGGRTIRDSRRIYPLPTPGPYRMSGKMSPLSSIKNALVPHGKRPRRIVSGILKGAVLQIDLTCQSQLYLGLMERELHPWFARLSKGIVSAIDIGASEGIYSIYFLLRTSATEIFIFEPDDQEREYLESNLSLNHILRDSRVILSDKFVGIETSECNVSLDSFNSEFKTPCLVKIDIEGFETDALMGASHLLRSDDTRWIIEVHSPEQEENCRRLLSAHGYQTRIVSKAWWR